MSSLEYKKSLVNMDNNLTPTQQDLKDLLNKVWDNQDNLTKEDIQTLEYLSKK